MKSTAAFGSIALALCWTMTGWTAPQFSIVTVGLDDIEHTRDDDFKYALVRQLNEAGQVSGISRRYNGGSTDLGDTAWLFNGTKTIDIGLTGAEHTRIDGYKDSSASQLNEAGQVHGYSERYNSGSAGMGRSAWLYDGATTIDIGLTGPEHTRNDGYKYSHAYNWNEAGQIRGYSLRYNGGNSSSGRSAWLYDGATTIDIGLKGAEHTRNDGYRTSEPTRLNEAGQVSGVSSRYNGSSTDLGQSAWLYDDAVTIDIGLTGTEHTRIDGYKYSYANLLNEAGQVCGTAFRYNGSSTDLGQSSWLYDDAVTIDIGLTGTEHTRIDGYKYSFANRLNKAGQVKGVSSRYNGGSTNLGYSAWLFDGITTIDIGLTGFEHTRNDNYKIIVADHMNEIGQVGGYSLRYNGGSTELGRSVWLYDGTTTIDIGLRGVDHTRGDGYKYSFASKLNEDGQVIGYSNRFNGGSTDLGRSAWLYDGTTTIDVGLTDAEHTRDDGYKYSLATQFNAAGQVGGYSHRYEGGTRLGQDAWFYDPGLDQTFTLQLSASSSGQVFSEILYLGDDGLALGRYTLFDGPNLVDRQAFYFTVAGGLHDLGSLVDGGLTANGWDRLADAIRVNGRGQLVGHGELTSQFSGQMAYLLTPVVDVPGDFNRDGVVDGADYTTWRDGLDSTFSLSDYDVWRSHFGQSSGSGAAIVGDPPLSAVPEFSSTSVILLGALVSVLVGHLPRMWRSELNCGID